MADLAVQMGRSQGITPYFTPADPAGDKFLNQSGVIFKIRNADTDQMQVTITATGRCNQGFLHPIIVDVPPSQDTASEIGPFTSLYQDAEGKINVTYSLVTGVTVAVTAP